MTVRTTACLTLLLAALLASAGEASRHDDVLKEMVGALDKLGGLLEAVKDEDSAKGSRPELKKHAKAFLDARATSEKLPPPGKAEKDRLEKEYRPKVEEAMKKLFTQVRRVERVPGGDEALAEVRAVLKKEKDGK